MNIRAYLTIEGADFDPVIFHEYVGSRIDGQVCERLHLSLKSSAQRRYWKSKELIEGADIPDRQLIDLIHSLIPLLDRSALASAARVSAQIVVEYTDSDSQRGYYLSKELVEALATLHADLDIDITHVSSKANLPI